MAICLRASKGNLAATEWSEGIGIEIKVKSASIPDKETFFNTNQQQKLLPCFEPGHPVNYFGCHFMIHLSRLARIAEFTLSVCSSIWLFKRAMASTVIGSYRPSFSLLA